MKRREFFIAGAALGTSGALRLHAKGPGQQAPLKVALFTDVHALGDAGNDAQLDLAAAQIKAWGADLLIGGGDYMHGGFNNDAATMRPRWESARRFLDSLKGRTELIFGNHDMVGAGLGMADPYRVIREELGIPVKPRRFTAGDYTFFCLNSVQIDPSVKPWGYRGEVDEAQLAWLDTELAQLSKDDPIMLITHIPFHTLFVQAGDDPLGPLGPSLVVTNAKTVLQRLKGHNLIGVLQGHLHLNEQLVLNGRSFITGGAVCGGWWKGPNRGTYRGSGTVTLGQTPPVWSYASYA